MWMAKSNANERHASGKPVPQAIRRMLESLVYDSRPRLTASPAYEATACPSHRCRTSFQSSNQRQRAFSERLTDLMRRYTKSAAAHLGNSDCRASRRSSRPSNCRPRTCWRRSPGNSSACADDVRAKLRPYEGEELLGVDNIDHSVIEMAKEAVAEGTAGPL